MTENTNQTEMTIRELFSELLELYHKLYGTGPSAYLTALSEVRDKSILRSEIGRLQTEECKLLVRSIQTQGVSAKDTMRFVSVKALLPEHDQVVLAQGWTADKKHYVYAFAEYEEKVACKRWKRPNDETLNFEPIAWAAFPQPDKNT